MSGSRVTEGSAQPVRILVMAAWFGLVTGFAEVAALLFQKFVQHRFLLRGRDAVWMIPVFDLVFFGLFGLLLWGTFRLRPRSAGFPIAVGVLAFLSFTTLLMMYRLYTSAVLVLAAGLAVQSARAARLHAPIFWRVVRSTTGWMAAVVAALAVALPAWRVLAERRALSRLSVAAPGAPNVLVVILDTVRSFNLSLYGYFRPTSPELERWARSGVRFERAFSTSSWTLPSHASLFTGRYPHELAAHWDTPLESGPPTLAEILGARGYATAGFVANTTYGGWESGLRRGFVHYEDYEISVMSAINSTSLGQAIYPRLREFLEPKLGKIPLLWRLRLPPTNEHKLASEINDGFLRWLDVSERRPFFVFLNYMEAHIPYRLGAGFEEKFHSVWQPGVDYSQALPQAPKVRLNSVQLQPKQDAYDNSIAYLDSQLAALFAALEKRGLLENTMIVLTSDHGEEFAEHGLVDHGNSLYRQSVQVPLVLSFPGAIPADRVVRTAVSLRDVPATILSLLPIDRLPLLPGRSLSRFWLASSDAAEPPGDTLLTSVRKVWNQPEWYPASRGDMYSLTLGGFRYIKNVGDGQEELYDFERDSLEQNDLAKSEQGRALLPALREALNRIVSRPIAVQPVAPEVRGVVQIP